MGVKLPGQSPSTSESAGVTSPVVQETELTAYGVEPGPLAHWAEGEDLPPVAVKLPSQKVEPPKKADPPKKSELAAILAQVAKEKGDKVIVKGSQIPDVERIPTGVFEFDLATGGGFPKGRLSIVYGPESSGKTNICYCAVRNAQKLGTVVWVDLEGTFDPTWAAKFGVDVDALLVVKPGYGEEAADLIDALIQAEDVVAMFIDSVAVITSAREVDASTEKANVGTEALLVKRICNKLAMAFTREARRGHNPVVVLVNQTRFKIGVMFGDPETMPGGNTMKFMSSLTVRLYGKNKIMKEFHPTLPVFKDTNAVIKKAKVPIVSSSFEYNIAMHTASNLPIGETESWKPVSEWLRSKGHLEKEGGKWVMLGVEYKTLGAAQDAYYADLELRLKLQGMVIADKGQNKQLVEASDAAK